VSRSITETTLHKEIRLGTGNLLSWTREQSLNPLEEEKILSYFFFTSLSYLDGNLFKSRKCIRNHRRKNFHTMKMFLLCGTKGRDAETVLQVPVLCRLMILTINYVPLHVNPLVAYSRNIRQGKKALVETRYVRKKRLRGTMDSFILTSFLLGSRKRNYFVA
jgi:hypothetical protein